MAGCSVSRIGWGCDTALYRTAEAMRVELPARLAVGPRVIKRNRGNGGQGVWKVEMLASPTQSTDGARAECDQRRIGGTDAGGVSRSVRRVLRRRLRDRSAVQARLREGVVRCYMAGDRCAGFGHQKVKALVDAPAARAEAGPRVYTSNADPRFQRLRRLMEGEWTPQLTSAVGHPPARSADDLGRGLHARRRAAPTGPTASARRDQRQFGISDPDEASPEIARRVADRLHQSSIRSERRPSAASNAYPSRA